MDGFDMFFFKKACVVIGQVVIDVIKSFFNQRVL